MNEGVIIAIITGLVSVCGNIIANSKSMAIVQTKLEMLTEEVKKHNNFASRMPVVEEQIKVINHRLSDTEEILKNHREK